ncbi:MAG: hypothetical protein M0C28_44120 [Candidatus Moduliflexus flocculans]|nr:hypothetical protein [Candidatus Moduliflexus flocculans]
MLLYLLLSVIAMIVWIVSVIGVPYLAYSFSIDRSVTIRETLGAVRRFLWRILGCSCLGALVFLPFFFLAFRNRTTKFLGFSSHKHSSLGNHASLDIWLPMSFVAFGFFENDWGIREKSRKRLGAVYLSLWSTCHSWGMFGSDFSNLICSNEQSPSGYSRDLI